MLEKSKPSLLAHASKRQTFLGKLHHDISKWLIRRAVNHIYAKMLPVIRYKKKYGWVNPEIEALYQDISWLIDLDTNPEEQKNPIGQEKNTILFTKLRDIVCTHFDEDSYYNIRWWVLMHRIHDRRWEEAYDIAINRSNSYFNYRSIYFNMRNRIEPLPREDIHADKLV